jgi:hypothetical protein
MTGREWICKRQLSWLTVQTIGSEGLSGAEKKMIREDCSSYEEAKDLERAVVAECLELVFDSRGRA